MVGEGDMEIEGGNGIGEGDMVDCLQNFKSHCTVVALIHAAKGHKRLSCFEK